MTMNKIKIIRNKNRGGAVDTSAYSFAATENIRRLHKSLKVYNETPLIELKNFKGVRVFIKDESQRFGLKAFKGLGGVWAIYTVISRELGLNNPPLEEIFKHRDKLSKMTFITTTDGNHGKGVSWAAGLFGCKSYVFMPKGTVEVRAQAVRDAGSATVEITDMLYDDCVKYTAQLAAKNHWHLIQDTSWDGYEEIPAQIMLGALEQMNYQRPTHIFLQAGVGSMAGAIAAVFAEVFKDNPSRITIVEPTEVACFYETMKIGDGKIHAATGNCQTMMAGLNCATPCELAWKILRRYSADSAAIPDSAAVDAMKVLAAQKIISGESGCAGFALANAALDSPELRRALEINDDAIIFVINTEGDTDPENYNKVIRN